jgi:prepilin-type N-terminal cleavage/methylation domain-containing protein
MKSRKGIAGFSMMELVVVLAVIAILATLITPIITSYVDRARVNKARSDTRNIAAALLQFNNDTKVFPIFTARDQVGNGTTFDVLVTDGLDAGQLPGIIGWVTTNAGGLNQLLNENFLRFDTVGSRIWNGPYIEGLGEDPWATKYYITGRSLRAGSEFAGFVLSPGPNRVIETPMEQRRADPFIVGGDDIVHRIR